MVFSIVGLSIFASFAIPAVSVTAAVVCFFLLFFRCPNAELRAVNAALQKLLPVADSIKSAAC
jgi:hypothetical protein